MLKEAAPEIYYNGIDLLEKGTPSMVVGGKKWTIRARAADSIRALDIYCAQGTVRARRGSVIKEEETLKTIWEYGGQRHAVWAVTECTSRIWEHLGTIKRGVGREQLRAVSRAWKSHTDDQEEEEGRRDTRRGREE